MEVQEEILEAPESDKLRVEPPSSPPPNCAICLGNCTNKCFTDCCLHQFCFNCLLEWSKIKAECPLCKQPFKSIIYNIKSNSEYEEHVITNPERETPEDDIQEQVNPYSNFYLPNGPRPQRHYQFRTTLTLDPSGELAIQQLLLTHHLTNSLFLPNPTRIHRNPQRSIAFRRAIYENGWWARAMPDVTGRYRECSPAFFRENPAQIHRIHPWLHRELSALIDDYINKFLAQQTILELLAQYPIQSSSFKSEIVPFFRHYVDHFIHEFYNFVRSPLDMIGYDSHVRYLYRRPDNVGEYQSVSDEDSDVRVVDSPNDCIYVAPRTPEVIVIHSDNSDSDVIYRTPTPPVVIDLLDTDTEDEVPGNPENQTREASPKLPIKLRLKLKKNISKRKKKYSKRKHSSSNSDSSCNQDYDSTSTECSSDNETDWTPVKSEYRYTQPLVLKRKKYKKDTEKTSKKKYNIERFVLRNRKLKTNSSSSDKDSSDSSENSKKNKKYSSDTDSSVDLKTRKRKEKNKKHKKEYNTKKYNTSEETSSELNYKVRKSSKKSSKHKKTKRTKSKKNKRIKMDNSDSSDCSYSTSAVNIKNELNDVSNCNYSMAGPSSSVGVPSAILKGKQMWYKRPDLDEDRSSCSDDS